jgi:hypothetical protein
MKISDAHSFEGDLRKCRFDVFPYALVFRIRGDELQVIAEN